VAGRPRILDDAAILDAAVKVMGRVAPAKLTLALVANEVGLAPATLVQRFGSKRGLLLALAEHTATNLRALSVNLQDAHGSPLAALTELVVAAWQAFETPDIFANHLAFLCADLADPQFRELALASQQMQQRQIEMLLHRAHEVGELRAGTDTVALGAAVQGAAAGCGLLWAVDRRGNLARRQRAALEAILARYRVTPEPR
jgi:AcrR family transcriptional regulator